MTPKVLSEEIERIKGQIEIEKKNPNRKVLALKCKIEELRQLGQFYEWNTTWGEFGAMKEGMQSRVYVPNNTSTVRLYDGLSGKYIKDMYHGFPLETRASRNGGRCLTLREIPKKQLSESIKRIRQMPKFKSKLPLLRFDTDTWNKLFMFCSYSSFLVGMSNNCYAIARVGEAKIYDLKSRKIQNYEYKTVGGHEEGPYGSSWDEPIREVRIPIGVEIREIDVTKNSQMVILSARASVDLDTLEKKLGLFVDRK